ncbi:MAG: phosphatase PAP2 family protein [Flavobacteriales bacterium]|nr:phosphatase PAP2 family protein [Flavobacteriales bacterium]
MEFLLHLDNILLLGLNGLAGNSILDNFMLFLSAKWVWLPLYGLIFYAFTRHFGWSKTTWILVAAVSMLILTDQGSVQFFKEVFQRFRPCHNMGLSSQINLVSGKCGGQYGFISSHAANVFGLATFASQLLRKTGSYWNLLFIWAFLVSLSRIYLGVHYPSDIFVGAIFGAIIGYSSAKMVFKITSIK